MNDCWPVTSWAIVDYYLRPKPSYFAIARELRPFTVGMTRKEKFTHPDKRSAGNVIIDTQLEIWGTNSTLSEAQFELDVSSFDLHTDWIDHWSKKVVLAPNASTEFFQGDLAGQSRRTKKSERPRVIVVSARLIDEDGRVITRYSNWWVQTYPRGGII